MTKKIHYPKKENPVFMNDGEKMERIEKHFAGILELLGLDLSDDSLQDTPKRVAKMYMQELFCGLNPKNAPNISIFRNKFSYENMLIQKNIRLLSMCEHHFLPIVGHVHIAYVPKTHVIGLSKINRLVDFIARRPQLQERLTQQIHDQFCNILKIKDVAVVVEAAHYCLKLRGVMEDLTSTVTSTYSGIFAQEATRQEFLRAIGIQSR